MPTCCLLSCSSINIFFLSTGRSSFVHLMWNLPQFPHWWIMWMNQKSLPTLLQKTPKTLISSLFLFSGHSKDILSHLPEDIQLAAVLFFFKLSQGEKIPQATRIFGLSCFSLFQKPLDCLDLYLKPQLLLKPDIIFRYQRCKSEWRDKKKTSPT